MNKLIRFLPFLLLVLYYLLVERFEISWHYKFAILGAMLVCSLLVYLRKDKRNNVYLLLGISSAFITMMYFNTVA